MLRVPLLYHFRGKTGWKRYHCPPALGSCVLLEGSPSCPDFPASLHSLRGAVQPSLRWTWTWEALALFSKETIAALWKQGTIFSGHKGKRLINLWCLQKRRMRLVIMFKLTAALLKDNCAAEFVEPLSIETRSVDWYCVLWRAKARDRRRYGIDAALLKVHKGHWPNKGTKMERATWLSLNTISYVTHPVMDERLPRVLQLLD